MRCTHPPSQPWFRSVSGSPRSTFADCSLIDEADQREEGEPLAPKLTPLLLDSSSNSYVDTWLQVDDSGGGNGGGGGGVVMMVVVVVMVLLVVAINQLNV
jgi:hypothetical protein